MRCLDGKRVRSWPPLVGMVAMLLALLAMPSPGRATATARLGVSPHGAPGACASCHDTPAGAGPGAVRPIVANCRSCHPDADMHPVGMRPKDIRVAEGWPLEDGVVTCATCHAEPSCDATRDHGAPYLRGGTPEPLVDFCFRCHEPTALARSNPHQPPSVPGVPDDNCAACHSGLPPAGASPLASRLRLPPKDACVTCHPGPVHAGAEEHTAAVQRTPLSAKTRRLLPLLADGTIACFTCHDVHGAAAPAARGKRAHDGPDSMLALPAADGKLCRACHGRGP